MFGITYDTVNVKNIFDETSGVIVKVVSFKKDGTIHETHEIFPTKDEDVEVPTEKLLFEVEGVPYKIEYYWSLKKLEEYWHLEGETGFNSFYWNEFRRFSRILLRILRWTNGSEDNVLVGPDK